MSVAKMTCGPMNGIHGRNHVVAALYRRTVLDRFSLVERVCSHATIQFVHVHVDIGCLSFHAFAHLNAIGKLTPTFTCILAANAPCMRPARRFAWMQCGRVRAWVGGGSSTRPVIITANCIDSKRVLGCSVFTDLHGAHTLLCFHALSLTLLPRFVPSLLWEVAFADVSCGVIRICICVESCVLFPTPFSSFKLCCVYAWIPNKYHIHAYRSAHLSLKGGGEGEMQQQITSTCRVRYTQRRKVVNKASENVRCRRRAEKGGGLIEKRERK